MSDTQIILAAQYGFPVVVALVAFLYRLILGKLPEAQRQTVERTIAQVVQAVEQSSALVPAQVKKEYATNLVSSLLKKAGVKASPEQIDTLIEAAVYAINQGRLTQPTVKMPAVK